MNHYLMTLYIYIYKSSNSENVEHTNHSAMQKQILSTVIAWTLLCIVP